MIGKTSIYLILVAVAMFYSCTQEEICLSNQHAVQTGFYSALAKTDKDTIITQSSVYALNKADSRIYNNERVGKTFLPLSFDADTTIYVVDNQSLIDTIWFSHTKELAYISRDCGFTFNFELDSVWFTRTFIDSVHVSTSKVTYSENFENVKIYIY